MTTASAKKGHRRNIERTAMYILISVILVAIVYMVYGSAFRVWLVNQILNRVENDVLSESPDGISEGEVKTNFKQVKDANSAGKIDLKKLHQILDDYQRKKPSTVEINNFLDELRSTILTDSGQKG